MKYSAKTKPGMGDPYCNTLKMVKEMRYMLKGVLRFTIMAGETKLLKRIQMTWTPDKSRWVFFSVQKQGMAMRNCKEHEKGM